MDLLPSIWLGWKWNVKYILLYIIYCTKLERLLYSLHKTWKVIYIFATLPVSTNIRQIIQSPMSKEITNDVSSSSSLTRLLDPACELLLSMLITLGYGGLLPEGSCRRPALGNVFLYCPVVDQHNKQWTPLDILFVWLAQFLSSIRYIALYHSRCLNENRNTWFDYAACGGGKGGGGISSLMALSVFLKTQPNEVLFVRYLKLGIAIWVFLRSSLLVIWICYAGGKD